MPTKCKEEAEGGRQGAKEGTRGEVASPGEKDLGAVTKGQWCCRNSSDTCWAESLYCNSPVYSSRHRWSLSGLADFGHVIPLSNQDSFQALRNEPRELQH